MAKLTPCGRFVVLARLMLDRDVYEDISRWAEARDLRVQDAIQIALCAFCDTALARGAPTASARRHAG